jgi:hypothetical protein
MRHHLKLADRDDTPFSDDATTLLLPSQPPHPPRAVKALFYRLRRPEERDLPSPRVSWSPVGADLGSSPCVAQVSTFAFVRG